ncbi:thioredoxin domain-containing protein [Cucumibacter marinus]|uniref:thioredoxin domain-containing protein n=1 Tax=Cucumibacter marinus TaxID=1121252 RepID=UPI0003FF5A1F|nr:thioredoxin domain-containing protein [Cucumibacter marinus]
MIINRRTALTMSAMAALGTTGLPSLAFAEDGDRHDANALMNPEGITDRPLGPADAKVTVIEYASPTCPHCASFHVNTLPALKEQYIDTGKIQFILRPLIRNVQDAVVFMVAECSEDSYYEVLDDYFNRQMEWMTAESPKAGLLAVAEDHDFTAESFDACLADEELFAKIEAASNQARDNFALDATPTFYINGLQRAGAKSIEQMAEDIDPLL